MSGKGGKIMNKEKAGQMCGEKRMTGNKEFILREDGD